MWLHLFVKCDAFWIDSDRLGAVVCLIDANQLISQLKHVVSQRDDDELCISCSLLPQISMPVSQSELHLTMFTV